MCRFGGGHDPAVALRAGDEAHDPVLELGLGDKAPPRRAVSSAASLTMLARSAPVRPAVWPASASRSTSRASGLPWRVQFEDPSGARAERARRNGDLAVEAARPQECWVEDVRPVGGRDDDHSVAGLEAVHLDQQLVERLLALVVAAADARAAVPPTASISSTKMIAGAAAWLA